MNPTEAQLRDFEAELSPGSNCVDFNKFSVFMCSNARDPLEEEQEYLGVFRRFDPANTGSIPSNELKHIMTQLGEKLTTEEMDELMKEANPESKDRIDYVKFVKTMMMN
mmetsp:Transcript_16703/g.18774  ORF Transcript_16703/g.18774 Transcript_16703/m.18774 type:complete len:109 (+) Transcript_16703:117-443(+)